MRFASARASSAHSSIVMPATGMSGQTSHAPIRGCAPLCRRMSITSVARLTPATAASITASGSPTKVTTVRFVASPGSTSSNLTPFTASMASVICFTASMLRPSEKLGTHSIILFCIVVCCMFFYLMVCLYPSRKDKHKRIKCKLPNRIYCNSCP